MNFRKLPSAFLFSLTLGFVCAANADQAQRETWVATAIMDSTHEFDSLFKDVCREDRDGFLMCFYVIDWDLPNRLGFTVNLAVSPPEDREDVLLATDRRAEIMIDGRPIYDPSVLDKLGDDGPGYQDPYVSGYAVINYENRDSGKVDWGTPDTQGNLTRLLAGKTVSAKFYLADGSSRTIEFPLETAMGLVGFLLPDCCRNLW